jgi:hypothetical protein
VSTDDIPWGQLVRRIESQELTPFLGVGISRPPLPDPAELAAPSSSRSRSIPTDRRTT